VFFVSLWFNSDFEMKLVLISPEHDDPREIAVLGALLAAGLERYHVRKPHWPAGQLETWLRALPAEWRPRLVLHQHHELVATLGLGGRHWRDDGVGRVIPNPPPQELSMRENRRAKDNAPYLQITSRSCHDLAMLRTVLGHYDSVFFGPVFPSISKLGHGPSDNFSPTELSSLLNLRTSNERRTAVLALGGVTVARLPQIHALGFDGVAVLGAVWQADDPVAAFCEIKSAFSALFDQAHCSQRAVENPTPHLTWTLDVEKGRSRPNPAHAA
jgi:thiamine-phosphate pyrophosphorylase